MKTKEQTNGKSPAKVYCKARTCLEEHAAELIGPDGEKTPFCQTHYESIIRNLVATPWLPLQEAIAGG